MHVIERYLDWQATAGKGHDPLAELHRRYGRLLHPIVVALLKDDHKSALERLGPPPEWGSALGHIMREHVARMQSLGYRYNSKERELRRFDRYLQSPVANVLFTSVQRATTIPSYGLLVSSTS
jgi:integrase/recombinase XerD